MNIYQRQDHPEYQILATRIYVFSFVLCLVIASVFLRFQNQQISVTLVEPNMTQYDFLRQHYSESLSCACTRSSIDYITFIRASFTPCDGYIELNSMDVMSLFSLENAKIWTDPDWILLHMALRSFLGSCIAIGTAKLNTLMELYTSSMITLDLVDRSTFNAIINGTFINSFHSRSTDLQNFYTYFSDVYRVNQFQNQYMTTWTSDLTSHDENFIIRYRLAQWLNGTYCCGVGLSNCSRSLVLQDDSGHRTTFPGTYRSAQYS